ncbi:MAG TPA: hypothetical protein VNE16_13335 [Vicinamibacterales bacterium]|nr:hypothetical protein [Vicinamibacterales bacterium]
MASLRARLFLLALGVAVAGAVGCTRASHGNGGAPAPAPSSAPAPVSASAPDSAPAPPAEKFVGTYSITYTDDEAGVGHTRLTEGGIATFVFDSARKGHDGYTFWYKGTSQARGARNEHWFGGNACGHGERSGSGAGSTSDFLTIGTSSYSWWVGGWSGKFTASGKCASPKSGTAAFGDFLNFNAPVHAGSAVCGMVNVTHKRGKDVRHLTGHWAFAPEGTPLPTISAGHCAQITKLTTF